MREPIAHSAAQEAAQQRLLTANGSIRAAFESLGLDWSYEDVVQYLDVAYATLSLDADQFGRYAGHCMALAIVCVERDRSVRSHRSQP